MVQPSKYGQRNEPSDVVVRKLNFKGKYKEKLKKEMLMCVIDDFQEFLT